MLHLPCGNYLTPTAARRDTGAARVIETTYTLGQHLPRHAHDHVYMVVVVGGALRETALGREHVMTRGWFVFNGAGESHHDAVLARGTRCLNVELRPEFLARSRQMGLMPREGVVYGHAGAAIGAVGRLYSAVLDPFGELEVEEALTELLAGAGGDGVRARSARAPSWLPKILGMLVESGGCGIGLDALGAAAGLHRAHLCRAFRSAVGCTMGEYVRRVRADRAHRRLVIDRAAPALVAHEAGYADQSHMTRDLTHRYGRAPARLRRAMRN